MLKEYIDRSNSFITLVCLVSSVPPELCDKTSWDMDTMYYDSTTTRLQNSGILKNLEQKLSYLELDQRNELK